LKSVVVPGIIAIAGLGGVANAQSS